MTKIENAAGLYPSGVAVLTKPLEAAKLSTIIEIPETVQRTLETLENRVKIIAIGPSAWSDEAQPRAKIGDVVLVTKYAGYVAQGADGQLYRLVNDRDIFCVIDQAAFAAAAERAA